MRFVPSAVGLFLYVGYVFVFLLEPKLYFAIMKISGVVARPQPFSDLGAVRQAISCWQTRVNVYAPSSCACMAGSLTIHPCYCE